jgi:hypothetical protein
MVWSLLREREREECRVCVAEIEDVSLAMLNTSNVILIGTEGGRRHEMFDKNLHA